MNTELRNKGEEAPRQSGAADYFVVSCNNSTWYVSTEMARFIEECLDTRKPAKWVKFVDLIGSRVRLRTREIQYIVQCTADQRATEREFFRTMRKESADDRDWND
jgi:hypothetical protein